jgi:two-component system, LytTR family, sensor kinase
MRRILIFVGVTLISLLLAYHTYLLQGGKLDWIRLVMWQLSWGYLWLAFTPLIFYLASRYRSLLLHILFGEIITVVHAFAAAAIAGVGLKQVYDISSQRGIVVYALLVSLSKALEFHKKYRQTELETTSLQRQLIRAQFQSLKNQLRPEFLFQSLEEIGKTIRTNPDEADTLIARLGNVLRSRLES